MEIANYSPITKEVAARERLGNTRGIVILYTLRCAYT